MLDFIHRYEWKMEFIKEGKDLSLDFVKGICILLVLIHHTTSVTFHQDSWFFVWGYPAVPLFLLIQVFHSYKSGLENKRIRVGKIWKRAFFPFLFAEVLILVAHLVMHPLKPVRSILETSFYWGGRGPGSYYPWIYIQFAILLPLLTPLFRYVEKKWLLILFLLLSIGGEILCNLLDIPGWLYRLLFIRYIFLIYLGYLMAVRGIVLNVVTIALSVVSLVALYFFEIKEFRLPPFFYYAESWKAFHWICYFYIAYPMLYLMCRFFYWLPANGKLENIVCSLGHHSYAIYIFQLFYFSSITSLIRIPLSYIHNPAIESLLYIIIAVLVCSVPVIRSVRGISNIAVLRRVLFLTTSIAVIVTIVILLWRPFYKPVNPFKSYEIAHPNDDTLRVIMIGDSWVYFHETLRRDSTFENELKRVLKSRKVKVTAKGKGGAVSGEIYERMSAERMLATEFDLNNCSQPMIEKGADYCVISAGINDARQRRGKQYYVTNYFHIIHMLLSFGIRPVVMEIPDVEVDEAFEGNTLFYRMRSRLAMGALRTELYGTNDYRQALKDSLVAHHLMDRIVYIPYDKWNPEGWRDKRDIYTDDHFHLNLAGYAILDSTFAAEIVKDYRLRKKK